MDNPLFHVGDLVILLDDPNQKYPDWGVLNQIDPLIVAFYETGRRNTYLQVKPDQIEVLIRQ